MLKTSARKEQRKVRALERQAVAARRSAKEQLARLDEGGHRAVKERAKLQGKS
jgi:predicted  nucleic acid-binding Zn-ribbon protein